MSDCCDECSDLGLPVGPQGNPGTTIGAVATITIPSASVLLLNSTPYTLLPAPGLGKMIYPNFIIGSIPVYGGTPYATNTVLSFYIDTTTFNFMEDDDLLVSTIARSTIPVLQELSTTSGTILLANQPLMVAQQDGNPTAGNSDIVFYVGYSIIDI